jgi:hypothetical protein
LALAEQDSRRRLGRADRRSAPGIEVDRRRAGDRVVRRLILVKGTALRDAAGGDRNIGE